VKSMGESDLHYFYSTALHWSLTQFTPGSMEVVPRNSAERSFTILTLYLGLVMFSSMVSSITSAMNELRGRHFHRSNQRNIVNRYLRERRVSFWTGSRILVFLRNHGYGSQERALHEADVSALARLPEGLLKDLHYETYKPILVHHPLFKQMSQFDESCFTMICHMATEQKRLEPGEVLFRLGEAASKMFHVVSGELNYYLGMHRAGILVQSPSMACEAVLWMSWEHCGRMVANSFCDLVAVDSRSFIAIVTTNSSILHNYRSYAKSYCSLLTQEASGQDAAPRLTDLCNVELVEDIVAETFETQNLRSRTISTIRSRTTSTIGTTSNFG